ncbi:MAG: hypothetical protein R3F37_02210 [Candidatus Competibacteraceae bacterium]
MLLYPLLAVRPGWIDLQDAWGDFFKITTSAHDLDEIQAALGCIERRAKNRYGVDIQCENTPPHGVVFGYAINIPRCQGYRIAFPPASRKTTTDVIRIDSVYPGVGNGSGQPELRAF